MLTGLRAFILAAFTALGATTLGIATGVVWMVVTLYLRQPTAWFALPAGVLLAWVLRTGIHAPGVVCAGLAALATIMATLSVNVLLVGVQLAGFMGLDLTEALQTAGSGLLWQLARMATAPADIVWYGVGAALAAIIALRRTQP
jgi:vitamin B12 transport system permease protein